MVYGLAGAPVAAEHLLGVHSAVWLLPAAGASPAAARADRFRGGGAGHGGHAVVHAGGPGRVRGAHPAGGGHAHHRPSVAAAAKDPGMGRAGGVAAAVCGNLPHTGWLLAAGPVADAAAGCLVCQPLHGVLWLFPAWLFLHGLLSAAALAVFVLGRVLPAFLHGAGPHGAAAPVGLCAAGLAGPTFAGDLSAASAGDLWGIAASVPCF